MCKDSGRTKTEEKGSRSKKTSAHVQSALALLARIGELEVIRNTFDTIRAKHDEHVRELDSLEEMIEHEEDRLADEALALGLFEEEYECDCGCSGQAERPGLAYDDEEGDDGRRANGPDAEEDGDIASDTGKEGPLRGGSATGTGRVGRAAAELLAQPKPLKVAPLIFGALGVGCAIASLVSRWIAEEPKG